MEGKLGRYISIMYRQQQKYINCAMKKYNLGYSCWNFLLYISKNSGTSQKEMCMALAVDEALATRAVKRLHEQGFILRRKTYGKSRSYALYLTEQGEYIIPELRRFLGQWWEDVAGDMGKEEWSLLNRLMEEMAARALTIDYGEGKEG